MSASAGLFSPPATTPLVCPGLPGLPASAPPPSPSPVRAPGYPQRRPERTVLYQVVAGHLETFLQEARNRSEHGFGYPRFIERTFRRYLECGIFAHGFCRLRCSQCGKDMLLPFSCKGRGVCPSCQARRMYETAALLNDTLLPEAGYRQWVLSVPWTLRYMMARDPKLLSMVLDIFLRAIFSNQRRRARAMGINDPRTGAVTFVQRFGSALNLHVHFHSLAPDGVFSDDGDSTMTFHPLPPPSDDDVRVVATRTASRVLKKIAAMEDDLVDNPDEAGALSAALMDAISPPVLRRLSLMSRMQQAGETSFEHPARSSGRCAMVQGYSAHANVAIKAHDRAGLEKLCRYGLRSPIAISRLSLTDDGLVQYRLKRPWPRPGGTTCLTLQPTDFLRRLACLIPPPRTHQLRYHGVFSPSSPMRKRLPPPPVRAVQAAAPGVQQGQKVDDKPPVQAHADDPDKPASMSARIRWAKLIKRVFKKDLETCPHCGGRRGLIAFITDPLVVLRILDHVGLPTVAPDIAAARAPPQLDMGFDEDWAD